MPFVALTASYATAQNSHFVAWMESAPWERNGRTTPDGRNPAEPTARRGQEVNVTSFAKKQVSEKKSRQRAFIAASITPLSDTNLPFMT
jgi:hypothetical protein